MGAVLYGIGGIGKSESVRKYWALHDQEFEDTVCWINATSFATIEACFRDIADKCGIHDARNTNGNYKPNNDIVALVYRYFTIQKVTNTPRKTLFVFDNVDDQANLQHFRPSLRQLLSELTL